jgi:hypothetical protein
VECGLGKRRLRILTHHDKHPIGLARRYLVHHLPMYELPALIEFVHDEAEPEEDCDVADDLKPILKAGAPVRHEMPPRDGLNAARA